MIFMIVNFLLVLTAVHGQDTSSTRHNTRPTETPKNKRGLFNYEDTLIGPPPPPPFQTISYHPHSSGTVYSHQSDHSVYRPHSGHGGFNPSPSAGHGGFNPSANRGVYSPPTGRGVYTPPKKWTNVFGFDDITYGHIFNELNGVNYGISTHITPPPTALPSIFTNGYGYVNYGAPHDFETSYVAHDGRIVKQYSVHERHHNDHPAPRNFRPLPLTPTQTQPAQHPSFYNMQLNVAQPRTFFPNQQNLNPNPIPNPNQIPTFLNKNHGPVALGSGSLGFVRLPNGDVYLGSGSLGYISHKDHYDNVINISNRQQKTHPRGPTTFGHAQL